MLQNNLMSSFHEVDFPSTNDSSCPPKQLTDMVMNSLHTLGFKRDYIHLAKGGFGQVYKVHYQTSKKSKLRAVAVKVSYYKYNKSLPNQIQRFNQTFDKIIANRIERHKQNKQSLDSDLTYFTEEMVLQPIKLKLENQTKEFTLQFMELIQGKELYDFLRENKLNLKQLMTIFCSAIHALHFFHDGGVMFNDLKLENVMVDPNTFHVTFIDFYDSNTQCTHSNCKNEPKDCVYTFRDNFHPSGLHEDVFRLGLLFLDSITAVCHNHDNNSSNGLAGDSVKYEMEESYSYPQGVIQNIIRDTMTLFRDNYGNDESCDGPKSANLIISEMHDTLNLMLASDITKRPSVAQLLKMEPWRLCEGMSMTHENQKCFEEVSCLTERQSENKLAVTGLKSLKKISNTATASILSRLRSTALINAFKSKTQRNKSKRTSNSLKAKRNQNKKKKK